jgi:hypothetical protein
MYDSQVTFNDITSLPNFIKKLLICSKVIQGDSQTDKQNGYLISLNFLLKESRLKIHGIAQTCRIVHSDSVVVTK